MKKILKSRLVLTLASFVLIAAAIAVPLVSSIAHSAHANTVGLRVYVTSDSGGTVSVQNPDQMIMTADGSRLYVSGNNGIVVIDTASNTVIHTIPVSNLQGHPVVSPDGSRLYVSNTTLTVYDTNTYSILFTIPTDS